MKKNVLRATLTVLLALAFLGPIPTLAAEAVLPDVSAQSGEVSPMADQFITYYRMNNGIKQYRIWNATRMVWVTPWTNC